MLIYFLFCKLPEFEYISSIASYIMYELIVRILRRYAHSQHS